MNNTLKFKDYQRSEKVFVVGLIVWVLLQTSRFIAQVLINDINSGVESEAWMYPAYLDMFAAFTAFPLIFTLIRFRSLYTWVAVLIYLSISIVDHFGNFTTTALVGPPSIVEEGMNPLLIPVIQTVFDFIFLILLLLPAYRSLFFRVESK